MTLWASVILAAGKGTRMRSLIPKVLHTVSGREMLLHVLDSVTETRPHISAIIIDPDSSGIEQVIGNGATLITQQEQLGTGHALLQGKSHLKSQTDHILVINGDLPLITGTTLQRMMEHHISTEAVMTFLTSPVPESRGLGRVVRSADGQVIKIIEDIEATEAERDGSEVCAGAYSFNESWLWSSLEKLEIHDSGEYYLTDLAQMASSQGRRVETLQPDDSSEALGVNDRIDLARVTAVFYERTRKRWMRHGVTLLDPASIFIDGEVEIGIDTVIYPNTSLQGSTRIGESCSLGPQCTIRDSVIGDRCIVQSSVIEESTLENEIELGPFNHIRPRSYLETKVHLGNYVEIKESRLGRETRVGHFSYLGDSTLDANVNIGAGTITCNYDGVRKNRTVIGAGAFIGSDSMLIAPVKIGDGAVTGAGSVITRDVPPGTLAVGMPARVVKQVNSEQSPRKEQDG